MNRRRFASVASSALIATRLPGGESGEVSLGSTAISRDSWRPATADEIKAFKGPPIEVGMLIFPEMCSLDLFGPHTFLAGLMNVNVHLVWKNLDPLAANKGVQILPNTKLDDCPKSLDVLFVPGGIGGVTPLMRDDVVLDFLADRGSRARYVTSVCTGALALGAAGLLRGRRATTHWTARDLLPIFGATPVHSRIVEDGNCITGGGVTAGIDFGMTLSARLRGENYAKFSQLAMEYDPQPPYHSGSPDQASPELVTHIQQIRPKDTTRHGSRRNMRCVEEAWVELIHNSSRSLTLRA